MFFILWDQYEINEKWISYFLTLKLETLIQRCLSAWYMKIIFSKPRLLKCSGIIALKLCKFSTVIYFKCSLQKYNIVLVFISEVGVESTIFV